MSSDFYFRKWRHTLARLEDTVKFDLSYQLARAHDKKRCQATLRISSVLGRYMTVYNDIVDCVNHNLQVQKIPSMIHVLESVLSRISEIKSDLHKLECSNCQYFGHGLVEHHLTIYDAEMLVPPKKVNRPIHIQEMFNDIFARAKKRSDALLRKAEEEKRIADIAVPEKVINWWDADVSSESVAVGIDKQLEEKLSVETLRKRELVVLIQAHEKSRQVTSWVRVCNYKREHWAKELSGTTSIPAPYIMRETAAKFIQEVFRSYFELKRKKIKDCKRDVILGIRQSSNLNMVAQINNQKVTKCRSYRLKQLEDKYKEFYYKSKEKYLQRNGDDIAEEWRDFIRDWFRKWFEDVHFFHNIPTQKQGGATMIITEETPSPKDWLEKNQRRVEERGSNKNKTAIQRKYEQMEAKRLAIMERREERIKKKKEKILIQKMMKNPNMHPGFHYPTSKKTQPILEVIAKYNNEWSKLDNIKSKDVKEGFVKDIQFNNVCMEAKLEKLISSESKMRNELRVLKNALKIDYLTNNEKMPEEIKTRSKRRRRKLKIKTTSSENILERMEDLLMRGILKVYEKVKLEDFKGDPNFAGEDLRCSYISAERHNGDIRYMWWDSCWEAVQGFHKRLLVGPRGSGKSLLVQILASFTDATLFELDPVALQSELLSPVYLQQIVNSVASCAKATQPSVIHIKNIQKLYYSKVPEYEKELNLDLIKRYISRRLCKKFHKTDNITIIGTCEKPWMTKTKQLVKQFPSVILLPNTTYSTVIQMLKDWVLRNPAVPKDLDLNTLAYTLQGYSYGYLKESLEKILSPQRIIRISTYGLSTEEAYDIIIGDNMEPKPDYEKYLKWYTKKTMCGRKEIDHIAKQQLFHKTLELYTEKAKKKRSTTSQPSTNSSFKSE